MTPGVPSQTPATAAILPAHQLPPLPVQRMPYASAPLGGIARSVHLHHPAWPAIAHPGWPPGQARDAAEVGAGRRPARRRGRADESIARSAPCGLAAPLPPRADALEASKSDIRAWSVGTVGAEGLPAEKGVILFSPLQAPDLHVCAPGRTRTCNLRIRSPLLYPLSYRGSEGAYPGGWRR